MKRPVGVILSCVLLGLLAVVQLGVAAVMTIAAFAMNHSFGTSANHPASPAPPSFVFAFAVGCVFFALLTAAWSIATLAGLVNLRNWARCSVLVIGACLVFFGVCMVLGTAIMAAALSKTPAPPNLPAHTMQGIVAFYGFFSVLAVALGIAWLVYFNLRRTKAYFLPLYATPPALYPSAYPGSYLAMPPPPPTGLGRLANVPVPITVLACLFLLGAPCCAIFAFLPLPGFFCGFLIPHPASVFLYLGFAAISGIVGVGFLRLDNRARRLCYAYMVIGLVNFLILVTPWGQQRYAAYNAAVASSMHTTAAPSPLNGPALIIGMVIFCILFYGIQIWILERYRYAFLKQPPPAPDPLNKPLTL